MDPTGDVVTAAVLQWVERTRPGARVARCSVRPLPGGAVARWVEQVTLHLAGGDGALDLVRKDASALEIAGLRAAQAVRSERTGVPELVASGDGWLTMALAPGSPLAPDAAVPAGLFDTLAALHARYHGGAGLPAAIPRVTPAWWRGLCRGWVEPRLRAHAGRHPQETIARARVLIGQVAGLPAVPAVLAELTPTLVHGDVHRGNVLADADRAVLIDWGSSRVGPAALDLANLARADSAGVTRYARRWQELTGRPLDAGTLELGYRWAALQIPVQYLPWTTEHRPTRDVAAALDRIEVARDRLSA